MLMDETNVKNFKNLQKADKNEMPIKKFEKRIKPNGLLKELLNKS